MALPRRLIPARQRPRSHQHSPVSENGGKVNQPFPVIFGKSAEEATPSRWM